MLRVTEHTYDEGNDGLHAWTARKPTKVKTLCEQEYNMDEEDDGELYVKLFLFAAGCYQTGLFRSNEPWRDFTYVYLAKTVQKRRVQLHARVRSEFLYLIP